MKLGPQLKFRATEEMGKEVIAFVKEQPAPYNKSDFLRAAAAHYLATIKGKAPAPQPSTNAPAPIAPISERSSYRNAQPKTKRQ
jgi:hypothetical protein